MRGVVIAGLIAAAGCLALACSDDETPPSATSRAGALTATPTRPTPIPRTVSRPSSNDIDWEQCDEVGFECATLDVPLDYADPTGPQVALSMVRYPAEDSADYLGPLFLNPGGPGASAIPFALDAPYVFPREIVQRFDIIGIDPRGVGESEAVDCGETDDSYFDVDFTPEDDAERDAVAAANEQYASDCFDRAGDLLPHVGTLNAARDLEAVREAMGADQISFFGYSYGSLLGAAYADLFPERVRAMVLDGAIDPTRSFEEREGDSARAFERTFDAFLDDCAARRACDFYSEGDPRAAYDALLQRLEREPLEAIYYEETFVTADDARMAVAEAMYDRGYWVQLAYALVTADRDGDGTGLIDLAYPPPDVEDPDDEEDDEIFIPSGDANTAIRCIDGDWPDDPAAFDALAQELERESPRVGWYGAYFNQPCASWLVDAAPLPEFEAAGAPPILVIGVTGDPATPIEWARALAGQLESGVLLTYEGYTHTVAFTFTSECVDEAALLYLLELQTPPEDAVCRD